MEVWWRMAVWWYVPEPFQIVVGTVVMLVERMGTWDPINPGVVEQR